MIKLALIIPFLIFTYSCNDNKKQAGKQHVIKAKAFKNVAVFLYDNFDTSLLNYAVEEISSFYHCKTTILPPQPLPSFAFYESKQRYKADSLIKFQSSIIPPGVESVVGLTMKDISSSLNGKQDWGIFGLGYLPGNACIVSVFRLKSTTYDQYRERFGKVLLHELGHNQGLPHCNKSQYCLMNDAKGTAATVDKEKKWLCDNCRKLLSN